jgi:exopolyphosphatase/guanosine-5'-triphosphate,3'-diphosphate pyrophosphatase
MIVAIIDCGTNTFHLLIIDVNKNGDCKSLYKAKMVVKLGEGGIHENIIREIPYKRGLAALKNFSEKCLSYKIEKRIALGTAAIRNAKNGKKFLADAEKLTGIDVRLIDGNREAELIFKGVSIAIDLPDDPVLIMDIGGGSVEFIIAAKTKILWKKSYKLGASLLLEQFKPSDPLTISEKKKLIAHFKVNLLSLQNACKKFKPQMLIGSSGSFETFAEIIESAKRGNWRSKKHYAFDLDKYKATHNMLIISTIAERLKMKGLVKMRVDLIVMASLLLTYVIDKCKIKKMLLSSYALKEGILNETIESLIKS